MTVTRTELRNRLIRRFPSDPDRLATVADVKQLEQVPYEERFPYHSPSEVLALATEAFPEAIAVTYLPKGTAADTPVQWNYRDYQGEVYRAANLFHSLGLQYDESVVFLLPNVPQLLFGLWGAQTAGIAAPINPFLETQHIASIAQAADARIIVTLDPSAEGGEELWEKATAARNAVDGLEHIITIGAGGAQSSINWAKATAEQPADHLVFDRKISGEEVASYFHTGGTTGAPKLAMHTHRAQVLNVCQMNITGPRYLTDNDFLERDTILCGLPLFHVNAAFVSSLNAMVGAGEVLIAGPLGFRNKQLIKDFWRLVERHKVTFFAGVPTIYATLLEEPVDEFDTSSLINCGCGAAPMPVSLLDSFAQRTGADIGEGYGMTETIAVATTDYYYGTHKVGAAGMPIPYQGVRIAIMDDQGNVERDCGIDEVGVILHKSISTFKGYKQEHANKGAWTEDGWFNSGDMGRFDSDGYLWLVGRAKDLIIRGGHNIDPLITEDALSAHPAVELAAAVGKPDAYSGEVPVAFVQLLPGESASPEELLEFARKHVSERAAAPAEVTIYEAIPVTAVGKIFKPDLRKTVIADAFREAANTACPGTEFDIEVIDDKKQGTVVRLRPGQSVDSIEEPLRNELNKFTQRWELAPS